MQSLRQNDQEIIQSKNTLILKNIFNITFRMNTSFRGAKNNQYFFSDSQNIILFGYQQFILNGQLKILKKYELEGASIILLDKSNEFFLIKPLKLEFWKFDYFHNRRVHQIIYEEEDNFVQNNLQNNQKTREIGINLDENILVFQIFKIIFFFSKNQKGQWNREQTIASSDYHQMEHIRFNQSNNTIVASQVDKVIFNEYCLIIIHKNQNGIWEATHHIQESLNPFYFIDDQQLVLFEYNNYLQRLSEINILDHKAQVKTKYSCGNYCFQQKYCYPSLIEIKSKNLVLLDGNYFFSLQQPNLFLQLSRPQFKIVVVKVGYDKNREFLFLQLSDGIYRKLQVYKVFM